MNPAITVAIAATYEETRVLAPRSYAHRWAMPLLLESLALGGQPPLRVVLYADSAALSSALQLTDDLGLGRHTLFYEVEIIEPVGGRVDRKRWGGFDELGRWCHGERP